jgi:hypothetical protein
MENTLNLFEEENINDWKKEWVGMPDYNNIKQEDPFITATFKFRNQEDFDEFNKLIKKHLYNQEKVFDGMQRKDVKSTWYPLSIKANKYLYTDESTISNIHN